MALLEEIVLEVGAAVAKSVLKFWLKDSILAEDISAGLVDIFKAKTSDVFAQRKGTRQFAGIGDKIGESLLPIFKVEGARLDEGDVNAVALAVIETFNKSKLSSELLIEQNLQPSKLANYLISIHDTSSYYFGEASEEFYKRIIKESCTYIVDIASQLPSFTEHTFAEILKQGDQILDKTEEILSELHRIRGQLDPAVESDRFEIEYRQAIARNLDVLYLIGADVSIANRRHKLSVAYITLSVTPNISHPQNQVVLTEQAQLAIKQKIVQVDAALANAHRLLIRGPAGSGKTTLLQWIAVTAATKSFKSPLLDWNELLPFYIRLRHYVQTNFPRPENFLNPVAPAIANLMPQGWVHNILRSGRAVILVDGVDEIPYSQREEMHIWLKDLVETYKEARFIITSRPHAVEEGWLDLEGLNDAELQPMELIDIDAFIDHWHEAVRQELFSDEEKYELIPLAEYLKEHIKHTHALRSLATNPLLCAMLCALNRDRKRQLPLNRIELYKACCSLLLERRDKESRIDLSDYVTLNYSQKQRLLEDLALWMIQKNLSEAATLTVEKRFKRKLANMPGTPQDVSGYQIRKFFVERSGIIREPVLGEIDFAHRTFQEFFAAQAGLDSMDVEVLVRNAHDDQWREVILLAAGLASKTQCEKLVHGLIHRGDRDIKYRSQLHLIAVSCLETAIELGVNVTIQVEKRLKELVPPKNMTDATSLAAAGELAVKHLSKKSEFSDAICAACIRTLANIAGESALDTLVDYADDSREVVVNELLKAWDSFDRETYTKRVLSITFSKTDRLQLKRLPTTQGLQFFTNLTSLDLSNCTKISDLKPLAGLTNLTTLDLSNCTSISDLTPLADLTNLTSLNLAINTPFRANKNIALKYEIKKTTVHLQWKSPNWRGKIRKSVQFPIKDHSTIIYNLNHSVGNEWRTSFSALHVYLNLTSLSILNKLSKLINLNLSSRDELNDLKLTDLTHLTTLDLSGCTQLSHFELTNVSNLTTLNLSGCTQIADLARLAKLINLKILDLSYCTQFSRIDLVGITTKELTSHTLIVNTSLNNLKTKDFSNAIALNTLKEENIIRPRHSSHLTLNSPSLINLTSLNLAGCTNLQYLKLAGLVSLKSLDLANCYMLSILNLADLISLTVLDISDNFNLNNLNLKGLANLVWVDLSEGLILY